MTETPEQTASRWRTAAEQYHAVNEELRTRVAELEAAAISTAIDNPYERIAELEATAAILQRALIESNLLTHSPAQQGQIAQDALNETWHVLKAEPYPSTDKPQRDNE